MRILSPRLPEPDPHGRSVNSLMRFDVALTDDIRLFAMTLKRTRDGAMHVFAPTVRYGGNVSASLSPSVRAEVTKLAASVFADLAPQPSDTANDIATP